MHNHTSSIINKFSLLMDIITYNKIELTNCKLIIPFFNFQQLKKNISFIFISLRFSTEEFLVVVENEKKRFLRSQESFLPYFYQIAIKTSHE